MGDFMQKESKQHFLLSAKARTLSVYAITQITHEQAFLLFKVMRWGNGNPICPQLGVDAPLLFPLIQRRNKEYHNY